MHIKFEGSKKGIIIAKVVFSLTVNFFVEICRLLLDHGAHAYSTNSIGKTAAEMAAFVGWLIAFLSERTVRLGVFANIQMQIRKSVNKIL